MVRAINIKLTRIVKQVDGYYLQIITDFEIPKCNNQAQLAIDLGISQFVVTSDGEYFENIFNVYLGQYHKTFF